ncbi:MAG: GtrA family protein [Muribaculaceae bacterium]|jgi:putative flippase GtrA|nr:GtrA family protein [Muribaculaceae bacterium]
MKIDKAEARQTGIQLLKYAVIGASNTLITMVAFYLLNTKLDLPYGISNVIGYVLGVINSFVWNRNWVFKTKNNVKRELFLFVCGFLICLALQLCVSWILLEGLGWKNLPDDVIPFFPMQKAGQNIVMILAMVAYTLANYVYNRFVTFRVDPKGTPGQQ